VTRKPVLSIAVVAYNSDLLLRQCLSSVRGSVLDGFAELIVVDNASPDESARIVAEEFPEATLVRSEVNRGFAGGCNLAWPLARGQYWLLLNPDVVVPAGGLAQLVEWMDAHPELGAGSPWLATAKGQPEFVGRRAPSLSLTILEALRLHLLIPRERRADLLLGPYWVARRGHLDVDWIPGAAMIVRRETVEAAGLLSDSLPMYGEDTEWCWRIRKAGWQIGVCGDVEFEHREGHSALRTWGELQREVRMWEGMYAACAQMRGAGYCRMLMAANALALAIEAHHPRRSPEQRSGARRHMHVHLALLRGRTPAAVRDVAERSAGR